MEVKAFVECRGKRRQVGYNLPNENNEMIAPHTFHDERVHVQSNDLKAALSARALGDEAGRNDERIAYFACFVALFAGC